MADLHRIPDQRQVLREASEWLARLQADDATSVDRARFEAWRSAHPMHGRAFDELAGTLGRFKVVRHLVHAVAFGQSVGAITARYEARKSTVRHWWRRVGWAAAVVGVIIGCAWLAYPYLTTAHLYATAIGEHATVSLPDGSTIELDSDSRARVDFSRRYRVIHLEEGEAFFKVEHDAERPFLVLAGDGWVEDVGTAFNVDVGSNGVRVTVREGEVKVGTSDPLFRRIPFGDLAMPHTPALSRLTAGQEAEMNGTTVVVQRLTSSQLARAMSWRAGTLYFEDQPLSVVIEELRRYTPLTLEVPDAALRNLSIAGTFQANPQGVQTFLVMLQQGLGLAVQRDGNRVVIERAGPSDR